MILKQKCNRISAYIDKSLSTSSIRGNAIFESIRHYILLQYIVYTSSLDVLHWSQSKQNHEITWTLKTACVLICFIRSQISKQ